MNIFESLSKNKINKKYIALSFDDGPSEEYTRKILTILKRNNAKASFFVLGSRVEENAHLLNQIIKNNCEIANHTYNHEISLDTDESLVIDSIKKTQDIIYKYTNISPKLLRLPGGHILKKIDAIKDMNLCYIGWNVDSGDWFIKDVNDIYLNTNQEIKEGCIVVFHDIYDYTVKVLNPLLKALKKEGYVVTTVSELFEHYGIELEAGKVYKEANIYE